MSAPERGYCGRGGGGGEHRGRSEGRGGGGYRGGGGGGGEHRGRGEGRGGGGYRGGGGGGYRGGGGGGGEHRGRGRGRGGGDGSRYEDQEREKNAIRKYAAEKKFNCTMDAVSNLHCLFIDVHKEIYVYRVSYEMKGGAKDLQDCLKEKACYEMLRSMQKLPECQGHFDFALCVCTGQLILSPERLPKEEYTHEFRVTGKGRKTVHIYVLSIGKPDAKVLKPSEDQTIINSIVGKAVQTCYAEKMGSKYVNVSGGTVTSGGKILAFDCLIPKAFVTVIGGKETSVLQLDVSVTVASAQNCLAVCEELKRHKDFQRVALERFVNKKVCTMFQGFKGAAYKVIDICFSKKANQVAGLRGTPDETFVGYFLKRYGLSLNPEQLLFECRQSSGKKVLIPPEVLHEMSISEFDRRQLPVICSLYPNERAQRVKKAVERLQTEDNGRAINFLRAFGISFEDQCIKIKGHVLSPVEILVPGRTGFKLVKTLGDTTQQGFVRELRDLKHTGERTSTDVVVYDETGKGKTVIQRVASYLDDMNASLKLGKIQYVKDIVEAKNDRISRMAFAFLRYHKKDEYRELKAAWTNNDAISQVVAKDLTGGSESSIVMAVAQQVCAKGGQLNWVVDIDKLCPSLTKSVKSSGILIIGADFGRDLREIRSESATVQQDVSTVAFVAFYVRGKQWLSYCSHHHVSGRKQFVYGEARDSESSTSGGFALPSEVLSEKLKDFFGETKRHFAGKGLQFSAVLVLRGCASEGELLMAKRHDADLFAGLLQDSVPWAVVASQRYQHTRFSAEIPNERTLCNVPRGFVTAEGTDKKFGEAFFLSGANCTLGHARSTLYVVLARNSTFDLRELEALIYGLCYLYPNKTDALPIPLPLKCAAEYAKKFVALPNVKLLPKEMRTKLHYL